MKLAILDVPAEMVGDLGCLNDWHLQVVRTLDAPRTEMMRFVIAGWRLPDACRIDMAVSDEDLAHVQLTLQSSGLADHRRVSILRIEVVS